MGLRLPLESFQTGYNMGMQPGANPVADAIKGVVQRYQELQGQKEKFGMEVALHKEKLKTEYGMEEERLKNVLKTYGGGGRLRIKPDASGKLKLEEMFTPEKIEETKGIIAGGGKILDAKTMQQYNLDTPEGTKRYLERTLGPQWDSYDPEFSNIISTRFPEKTTETGVSPFAGFAQKVAPFVNKGIGGLKDFGYNLMGRGVQRQTAPTGGGALRQQAMQSLNEAGYPITENNIKSAMEQLQGE